MRAWPEHSDSFAGERLRTPRDETDAWTPNSPSRARIKFREDPRLGGTGAGVASGGLACVERSLERHAKLL
jgi:hypothetical protein